MKFTKSFVLILALLSLASCRNGARKTVCTQTENQEYDHCYSVSTGVCNAWQTSCSSDSFGSVTCTERCVGHEMERVCETRVREVCVRHEYRYYCKATREWMTDSDFNSRCPAPPKKHEKFAPVELAKSEHNNQMLQKGAELSGLSVPEIVSIIETQSATPEQMTQVKSKLDVETSEDAFSLIQQIAEDNLDLVEGDQRH